MSRAGRFLAIGVVAVLITGCASTNAPAPAVAPGVSLPVEDIPWRGADLRFFYDAIETLEDHDGPYGGGTEAASAPPEISLGASATVTEVLVATTFSDWDLGRTVLVDGGVLEEQAAARLERVVLRRRGESISGYFDVASRRLPAALSLHWSGWERLGLGEWRDPDSQIVVRIPKDGAWVVSRGASISAPLEESITGGAVGRLAATAGSSGAVVAPVIVWAQGPVVAGIPPQLLPSQLAVIILPAEAAADTELRAHVVLPFPSEQDARVAMVISRLVVPAFLREAGLERGPSFAILRTGEELYVMDVVVTYEQLSELIAEAEIQ